MGLEKISEKLDTYFKRLEHKKAPKIKPEHVKKAIAKLQAKEKSLKDDLADTKKSSKKKRLKSKLGTVGKQIERAEWLLENIGS